MTTRSRRSGILSTILLAVAVLATAPQATAEPIATIEPGERIDYINGVTGGKNQFCTIGHVYTGRDLHVYAVTAGHCRNSESGYVLSKRNGQTGTFLRTLVKPPSVGGPDYGLIDFGTGPLAGAYIGDIPTSYTHPEPEPGQTVCRSGVSSGQQCGPIVGRHGDQYLTTGMSTSVPGDSGAPVWSRTSGGRAQIIGIWLGEKISGATHTEYGRFASLAEGLRVLAAR